jgi:parallel beta-helix repeat protein
MPRSVRPSLLAFAVLVLAAVPSTAAAATFAPVADTYADAGAPATNFGRAASLRVDATPVLTAYLRFSVAGVGTTTTARLRVFAETANSTGFDVRPVASTTWGETTLTAQNAPAAGAVIASSGPVAAGTWYTVDVSSAVHGDGVYSFALTTTSATATRYTSREGTNPPQLITPVQQQATLSPIVIDHAGASFTATAATGVLHTGTLKSVVEDSVRDLTANHETGVIRFAAGDFDLGTTFFRLVSISDITFQGAGMTATVIHNATSAAADTEPFNFESATRVVISDLTIAAGGPARSTSDAIDFDNGALSTVERVRITASRARGIVFDGKNNDWNAHGNVVRDCVISGVATTGIQFLAATGNRVERCTISNVGTHGIQMVKSSTVADQANKKASDNVITGNTIDNAGQDGINVTSSDRNQITGNVVRNSSDDVASHDGIKISVSDSITADDNVISGDRAFDDQTPKTQRYGLHISSALANRTVVGPGNDFTGNLTAPIRNVGTGTIFR